MYVAPDRVLQSKADEYEHWPLLVFLVIGPITTANAPTAWKMSMYLTEAAGTVVMLIPNLRQEGAASRCRGPAVAWSRYMLDHHTPAQALIGAALGVAAPVIIFRQMHPLP